MLAAALAVAVLAGVAIATGIHLLSSGTPAAPTVVTQRHGMDGMATWAPSAQPAPPITALVDQAGHRFSLSSLHGHTVALVFFDSHCKQQCPLEGRDLAAAERSVATTARPVLVAVSVNAADTSASARRALRAWGLAAVAPWHWLLGTRAALARVWRAYHVWVGPSTRGDIPHTEAIYLIDRLGYERSAYLYPFALQRVAHDLRALS
jgi:cytochrome oxidase Cu insertion factor (SCO1/SenC/PrrC family)